MQKVNYHSIKEFAFESLSMEKMLRHLCAQEKWDPHLIVEKKGFNPFSPLPSLEIAFIDEKIGWGVFANEPIHQNTYLGFYAGLLSFFPHSRQHGDYYHAYPVIPHHGIWKINAEAHGNITRFYNHSFSPNLFKRWIWWEGLLYPCFFAKTAILSGQELRYNYGNHYWLLRGSPL